MGSVIPRKRKDGTIGYQAHVSIWRGGKPARRETKTFDRKPAGLGLDRETGGRAGTTERLG